MLKVIKAHAVKNLCYKSNRKMVPKGIVVHSTGANNPNLKRYVDCPDEVGKNIYGNHWNTAKPSGREVCVHAFIGYDKNKNICVAEILPLDICCWGVGKGSKGTYNYDPPYIQFEICEDALKDKEYYNKVFDVAAEYCASLCYEFNIDIENIVGHAEAYRKGYGSNHSDPEHWMKKFGENMDDFRNRVSDFLNTQNKIAELKNTDFDVISKGDLVKISDNATYYNGGAVPAWVKNQNWFVKEEPIGDRVVIDKNENGDNSICSPINKKYLTVVKKLVEIPDDVKNRVPYLAKVTVDCLNIRNVPSLDGVVVGCITDKGVYTIVEERFGRCGKYWGKLKSGLGWICLDFIKKI